MEVTNNKKEFRFEIAAGGGELATLQYRWLRGSMVLMHTLVPVVARGKGIGAMLVKYVLDYARGQHLKIIIYCPFVTKYVKEHPEYTDLVDETHPKRG
jgi:predicted GNAT family acetyltransferase